MVLPSTEKQDIQQLKRDIPKYDEAGIFGPDAKSKWENVLSNFPKKYGLLPDIKSPWILDQLKTLSERFMSDSSRPTIPEKILKKSQATKECRKVNSCMH